MNGGGGMSATCAKVIPNICKMREKGNNERGKEEKRKKGKKHTPPKKAVRPKTARVKYKKNENEK